jgi:hypothetical protein
VSIRNARWLLGHEGQITLTIAAPEEIHLSPEQLQDALAAADPEALLPVALTCSVAHPQTMSAGRSSCPLTAQIVQARVWACVDRVSPPAQP